MLEDVSKILVVDDEIINLELVSTVFADDPLITIITANSGEEALEILQSITPDVIVLDIRMQGISGIEVLKILKTDSAISHIPVIILSGNENEKRHALKLGANDFVSKPFDAEELKLRVMNALHVKKYQDLIRNLNEILQSEVRKKTKQLQEALELANEAEYEIVLKFGMIAEFKDEETGNHIRRMSLFCKLLAEIAGLSEEEQRIISLASPLHDVGKIGIPDHILKKPGKLTPEEFEIIKLHTVIGAKILTSDPRFTVLKAGRIIAEQHHEKWDGSGYPKGLKGEEIHIYARVVSICDVFDALTSDRVYRPAFPINKALDIMKKEQNSFDPRLFELFINNIDKFLKLREEFADS